MGMKSFGDFFSDFGKAENRSLQLTREVLDEREQLENVLKELQPQIHAGLTKMDELQRVVTLLQHNKSLIEQNKDFIIKVPVTKQRKKDTPLVNTPPTASTAITHAMTTVFMLIMKTRRSVVPWTGRVVIVEFVQDSVYGPNMSIILIFSSSMRKRKSERLRS